MYVPASFPVGIDVDHEILSKLYSIEPPVAVPALTNSCAVPLYVNEFAVGAFVTVESAFAIINSFVAVADK